MKSILNKIYNVKFFCICSYNKIFVLTCQLYIPDRDYWYELGRAAVTKRAEGADPRLKARNIVLLIADGLGVTTNTAARVFKGQRLGNSGEEAILLWDEFPAIAMTKVRYLTGLGKAQNTVYISIMRRL